MRRSVSSAAVPAVVVTCLVLAYFLLPMQEGGTWVRRALLHPLLHANPLHLAGNCLGAATLFRQERAWVNVRDLLLSYIIGAVSYAAAFHPVIGFSNVLFARLGLYAPLPTRENLWWWRNPRTVAFLAVMVLSGLLPGMSLGTHAAAFVLGMLLSPLYVRLIAAEYRLRFYIRDRMR